jgi:predicted regulator of Ras-like GTPase activity (Roadblock/LC7/MglB family)
VDAEQAIAELMEISSQVEAAVLVAADGAPVASSLPEERAARLARAGTELLAAAATASPGAEATQLEAATREGSLFVVRDGAHALVAATGATPTSGLVLYDLRSCLRTLSAAEAEQPPAKPARKRRAKKQSEPAEATDAGA